MMVRGREIKELENGRRKSNDMSWHTP